MYFKIFIKHTIFLNLLKVIKFSLISNKFRKYVLKARLSKVMPLDHFKTPADFKSHSSRVASSLEKCFSRKKLHRDRFFSIRKKKKRSDAKLFFRETRGGKKSPSHPINGIGWRDLRNNGRLS